MASFQVLKPGLSPISASQSNRKLSCFSSENNWKTFVNFQSIRGNSKYLINIRRRLRIHAKVRQGDNQSNGDEPPESLFMKELRRRGMSPNSLLEESNRSFGDDEIRFKEEDGGFSNRSAVSADLEKSLLNQRERSMDLNSEGLEGLIPRGKVLLTLGGTFFLSFGPLILITVVSFTALYLYFGATFVHGQDHVALPQYIDPYVLLEEERISQTAHRLN